MVQYEHYILYTDGMQLVSPILNQNIIGCDIYIVAAHQIYETYTYSV